MATKRMFSKDITASDAFLDMPASSQALYFHLGMEADDDGFIGNPKKVMRVLGVSTDDMKILLTKRFVLDFPSGVVVVKHHRINNNWDKYNCKRTMYLEEFSRLNIKENKAYTLDKTQGVPIQSENRLETVSRIEENRIEIVAERDEEPKKKESRKTDKEQVFRLFSEKPEPWWVHKQQKVDALNLFDLLGMESLTRKVRYMREHKDDPFCPQAHTPTEFAQKLPKLTAYHEKNS